MRILACIPCGYYGSSRGVDPIFYYFVEVPKRMGHTVCYLDYWNYVYARHDRSVMNDLFVSLIRGGSFDLVIISLNLDEFDEDVLDEAKQRTVTLAWNSDDDFRWSNYSVHLYPHFSFMATTYRHVYEAIKDAHPNVLLSQWACSGLYDGKNVVKDIGFGFVGGIHADRAKIIQMIQKRMPLDARGQGNNRAMAQFSGLCKIVFQRVMRGKGTGAGQQFRTWMLRRWKAEDDTLSFDEVNNLWNRTKVSLTPLRLQDRQIKPRVEQEKMLHGFVSEELAKGLQIKSRVFDMGLSGTLMLCDRNPMLEDYYERGKEYDDFESIDECVDRAKYYLAHEAERQRIALAYYDRTRRDHLWSFRLRSLFKTMGLE